MLSLFDDLNFKLKSVEMEQENKLNAMIDNSDKQQNHKSSGGDDNNQLVII